MGTVWDKDLGPNDLKEIDTILFIPDQDEPVDATKVSEFEKYFSWKSTCKFGLMLNKFWIDKSDERNCSFGLKCVQLAVTKLRPEGQKKSANSQLSRNLFTGKKIARVEKVEEVEEDVENNDKVEDEVDNDEEFEEDEERSMKTRKRKRMRKRTWTKMRTRKMRRKMRKRKSLPSRPRVSPATPRSRARRTESKLNHDMNQSDSI